MPQITNPTKGYPPILRIFQNKECYLLLCKGKGSKSQAPIQDLHVEVSPPVGDPSLYKTTSLVVFTTPFTIPMDGHHMSAIVTVPSPSLVLQNHFSSLEGLETTDVGGDPYIGTSTTIVEFNSDHITVENDIGSKFWTNLNEMEEDANDIGEEIVHTKRKPGRPPKGNGKAEKTTKTILIITSK